MRPLITYRIEPPLSSPAPQRSGQPRPPAGPGGSRARHGSHRARRGPGRRTRLIAAAAAGALVASWLVGAGTGGAAAAPGTGTIIVNGGGLGHGVGMSQWGAYGQAIEGATAEQIVTHYFTGTTVAAVRDSMDLRVNLLHQVASLRLTSVSAGPGGGLLEVIPYGVAIETGSPGDVFSLAMSGRSVLVTKTSAAGRVTRYRPAPAVTVRWAGTRFLAGGPTLVDVAGPGHRLGGGTGLYRSAALEVRVVGSRMEVNDVVRLHDEYLDGVAEVPSSWPRQALRAQVIASRSYALTAYQAGLRPSCDCHLYASTLDQVFAGWAKQHQAGGLGGLWTAAVASTSRGPATAGTGEAVISGRSVVRAYFFSSSGGRTRNSQNVWSAALPYARSVDDHWSQLAANPYNSWYRTFRSETVRALLFGRLPDLSKVLVTAKDAGGALLTVTAWSSSGASASVTGTRFAAALGLPSLWVWTVESNLPRQPAVDVLSTPGYHVVGTRQWRTDCHPYYLRGPAAPKWATLCTVSILAYRYTLVRGDVVTSYGWGLNNLTYLDVQRPGWELNPIALPGNHTTRSRQPMHTVCTPAVSTGRRQCEAWVYTSVVARTPAGFRTVLTWVLGSVVRLTVPTG